MAESMRESISAFVDGECSELELRRLQRDIADEEGLLEAWARYMRIRSLLRNEHALAGDDALALHRAVSEAVAAEPVYSEPMPVGPKPKPLRRYLVPAGALAAAASIVVAVLVAVEPLRETPAGPELAEQAIMAEGPPPPTARAPVAALPASTEPALAAAAPVEGEDPMELRELDEDKKALLRAYVRRHERLAKINPYRTAGYRDRATGTTR